ncbi:MAG: SGNH/GDSL hydrolase family protein [Solirubrobacterales bacterium]|nr:SGNH/GDSL hydrolase family protein [Solirubrobacterales bacterium]
MHNRKLVGAFVAAAALAGPAAAGAAPQNYVSLGDSYTSASGVLPPAAGAPLDCTQSAVNYPHLTAKALGLALTDRSCGGATTADMTTKQFPDQQPQFNALSDSTNVVTIGIGGNDNNTFLDSLLDCGSTDLADGLNIGAPCKATYGNKFADNIAKDEPVLQSAFAQIHTQAPNAKVFVVGYPDILPQSGNCWPFMPLTTGDTAYLNGVEQDLNSSLKQAAAANGDTYVDTYTPSIGHDACQPESNRWVEQPVPDSVAAPVHPNTKGEAADAQAVEAALKNAGV